MALVIVFVEFSSAVEVPIVVLGAEIDQLSPPALVKQFEEVITAKPEVRKPYCLFKCLSMDFAVISMHYWQAYILLAMEVNQS